MISLSVCHKALKTNENTNTNNTFVRFDGSGVLAGVTEKKMKTRISELFFFVFLSAVSSCDKQK